MKIYIASGLKNAENVKLVQRRLAELGHELSYDWTSHGSVKHLGPHVLAATAEAESRGVEKAARLIVLLPGEGQLRGTHVELGIALALGTPTIIHSEVMMPFDCKDGSPCAFYFSRFVKRVVSPLSWFITNLGPLLDGETRQEADETIIHQLSVRD